MTVVDSTLSDLDRHTAALRADSLYLDRCQVDTSPEVVSAVWSLIRKRRSPGGSVVDFGAGDGRFARGGSFDEYVGYEIDGSRVAESIPANAQIVNGCAFSHTASDADICIGNPPFVRNQDLPEGWRRMAAREIETRTGVRLSGLANAWQYFFMLGLSSVGSRGLVAQIIPYEWVSRPSAAPIREYIRSKGWAVDVYRLPEDTFKDVLTAASITLVDKQRKADWGFFDLEPGSTATPLDSETADLEGPIRYTPARDGSVRAKRGLSPGSQRALVLTEGMRVHAGLEIGRDVVPCVTSLRRMPSGTAALDERAFEELYVGAGARAWLVRTDTAPSRRLAGYFESVDATLYQTSTCLGRDPWWCFSMPTELPQVLISQAFKGARPKIVSNRVGALPIGGVAGIYGLGEQGVGHLIEAFGELDLRNRLVPYAKQMLKLEVNQINSLLVELGLSDV